MYNQRPSSDKTLILNFINAITEHWFMNGNETSLFQIRCIGERQKPFLKLFTLNKIDQAVDLIIKKNYELFNVYMTVNPIDSNAEVANGAKDGHISNAYFCFADADDLEGFKGLQHLSLRNPPDITVTTGTVPHIRLHHYWRLTIPCTDMDKWRSYQKRIAETYKTDKSITNPSRVMRIAGTITHPNTKKILRGYKPELVTIELGSSYGFK